MPRTQRFPFVASLLCFLVACDSGSHGTHPGVVQLVDALARSSEPLASPFSVAAEVINPESSAPALRFRLSNITQEQQVVVRGSLPWENASFDSVTGIDAHGRLLPIRVAFGEGVRPEHPENLVIVPSATLVGEMPLNDLFPSGARDDDVLLLWAYRQGHYTYTGIALLPKK